MVVVLFILIINMSSVAGDGGGDEEGDSGNTKQRHQRSDEVHQPWVERVNAQGRYYYTRGMVTVWEKPDNGEPCIPSPWRSHLDPGTGMRYLFNASTGESMWVEAASSIEVNSNSKTATTTMPPKDAAIPPPRPSSFRGAFASLGSLVERVTSVVEKHADVVDAYVDSAAQYSESFVERALSKYSTASNAPQIINATENASFASVAETIGDKVNDAAQATEHFVGTLLRRFSGEENESREEEKEATGDASQATSAPAKESSPTAPAAAASSTPPSAMPPRTPASISVTSAETPPPLQWTPHHDADHSPRSPTSDGDICAEATPLQDRRQRRRTARLNSETW